MKTRIRLIAPVIGLALVAFAMILGSHHREHIPADQPVASPFEPKLHLAKHAPNYSFDSTEIVLHRRDPSGLRRNALVWDLPYPKALRDDKQFPTRVDREVISDEPCRVKLGTGEVLATHALVRIWKQFDPHEPWLLAFELPDWKLIPLEALPPDMETIRKGFSDYPHWAGSGMCYPALAVRLEAPGLDVASMHDLGIFDPERKTPVAGTGHAAMRQGEAFFVADDVTQAMWHYVPLTLMATLPHDYASPIVLAPGNPHAGFEILVLEDKTIRVDYADTRKPGTMRITAEWTKEPNRCTAVILSTRVLRHARLQVEAVLDDGRAIPGSLRHGFDVGYDSYGIPFHIFEFECQTADIRHLRVLEAQSLERIRMDLGTLPMPTASPGLTNLLDVRIPSVQIDREHLIPRYLEDLTGYTIHGGRSTNWESMGGFQCENATGHEILRAAAKLWGPYQIHHEDKLISFVESPPRWKTWWNQAKGWFAKP